MVAVTKLLFLLTLVLHCLAQCAVGVKVMASTETAVTALLCISLPCSLCKVALTGCYCTAAVNARAATI